MFKEAGPVVDFPQLERRILKFWEETKAFKKRMTLNRGKKRWSFIDGPITANPWEFTMLGGAPIRIFFNATRP